MNSSPVVMSCHHITKSFIDGKLQVDVLKDINLSVTHGDLIAIVGASGSGKSTLLQLLGGLDKPTSGQVQIADQDIHTLNERKKSRLRNRYLGFIYQFHHLLPEFSAIENVAMPLLIAGVSPKKAEEKAKFMLDQVSLSHRMSHRLGELSGGERQRVAIARALINDPVCVLADEPTGNLDNKTAEHIVELLLNLNEKFKTSLIIVTHDLSLASKMHRTFTLRNGILL